MVEDFFVFILKIMQFVNFFPLLALVVISLAGKATVEAATGLNPPVKLVWHYYKLVMMQRLILDTKLKSFIRMIVALPQSCFVSSTPIVWLM